MQIDIHVLMNNNDIDRLNSLYINLLGYSLIKLDFILLRGGVCAGGVFRGYRRRRRIPTESHYSTVH